MPPIASRRPVLRLAELLRRFADEEGSYNKLEHRIEELNDERHGADEQPARRTVDRRKLKQIADGFTDVSFTFDELFALEAYFELRGESLARRPLLRKPDILQTLSETTELVFLLGARYDNDRGRTNLSDYDVLAMTEIQTRVSRFASPVLLGYRDVLLKEKLAQVREVLAETCDSLFDDAGPSLVSVGSPRACHASEAMLAAMFGVERFTPTDAADVPFHFVWPAHDRQAVKSAFVLHESDLDSGHRDAIAAVSKGTRALRAEDEILLAEPPEWERSRDVGVICCQRRASGQIWVCVAGLSGPGTLASAMLIDSLAASIPRPIEVGTHSDVLWAVVTCALQDDRPRTAIDIKRSLSLELHGQPRFWSAQRSA
jgi:hypothetical protein